MAAINLASVPVIKVDKAEDLHAQFITASKALAVARRAREQALERYRAARAEADAAAKVADDAENARESIVDAMRLLHEAGE